MCFSPQHPPPRPPPPFTYSPPPPRPRPVGFASPGVRWAVPKSAIEWQTRKRTWNEIPCVTESAPSSVYQCLIWIARASSIGAKFFCNSHIRKHFYVGRVFSTYASLEFIFLHRKKFNSEKYRGNRWTIQRNEFSRLEWNFTRPCTLAADDYMPTESGEW